MDERALQIDELLRHGDFLRSLARRLLKDEHLAEDVVQETFAAAIARPPAHTGNLRGWLATVARNLSFRRRRTEVRQAAHVRDAAVPEEEADAAETAARLETGRRLVTAVTALPEPYRTTVMRRWFDGLGPSEIARRSDIPVKTVETRLRRAHAMLRERLLEGHGGDRRAFALSLGLLAVPRSPAIVPTTTTAFATGGTIMGKKLVFAAAVLLAAGIAWINSLAGVPEPPVREPDGGPGTLVDATREESGRSEAPDEAPVPVPGEIRIAGIVTEDETGQSIPGAHVRAFDYERGVVLTTTTDGEGRFEVPGTRGATGAYHLVVTSTGWPRFDVPTARPSREPLAIRIAAGGVISGRVVSDGLPVTSYRIVAVPLPFGDRDSGDPFAVLYRQALPRDFAVATEQEVDDPEGRFRIESLAPWKYALVVVAPGHQPRLENGGSHLDFERGFDVEAGEEVEVEVVLPPTGEFRFRVFDAATGRPVVTGATFSIETRVGRYPIETEVVPDTVDADGIYRLALALSPRGTLNAADIRITCRGYVPHLAGVSGFEHDSLFKVPLVRAGAIRGTVIGPDGRPPAGVILLVERPMDGRLLARAHTASAGAFHIEGLLPGEPLVLHGRDSALRRTLFSVPITLRPGETRELDIGGAGAAAIIGIAALEGRPVQGARIFLYAEDGRRLYTWTGVDGRFCLEHLRPGRYRLFVNLGARDGEMLNLTRDLDLAEGERMEVSFAAEWKIEGVAVNVETGKPAPEGLWITARLVDGAKTVETRVLPDGRFLLRPTQAGVWELGCEKEHEWVTAHRPQIDLTRETRRTGVRLELFPDPGDGRIVIHVVDAKTGTPIAGGTCRYQHKITAGFPSFRGGRIELPEPGFDERLGLGEYRFFVSAEGHVSDELTVVLTPAQRTREVTVRLRPSEAVRILAIAEGTQAQEIGLRAGDLIVGYGGKRVRTVSELVEAAEAVDPSEPVTLELVRDGQETSAQARGGPLGVSIENSALE